MTHKICLWCRHISNPRVWCKKLFLTGKMYFVLLFKGVGSLRWYYFDITVTKMADHESLEVLLY